MAEDATGNRFCAYARWRLSLELATSCEPGAENSLTISTLGAWRNDGNQSPCIDVLAIDLAYLVKMVRASGITVEGDDESPGEVFADVCSAEHR